MKVGVLGSTQVAQSLANGFLALDHEVMLGSRQSGNPAAAQWAATFKDFPPVQKPNTFTLDDALRMMHETASGMH